MSENKNQQKLVILVKSKKAKEKVMVKLYKVNVGIPVFTWPY